MMVDEAHSQIHTKYTTNSTRIQETNCVTFNWLSFYKLLIIYYIFVIYLLYSINSPLALSFDYCVLAETKKSSTLWMCMYFDSITWSYQTNCDQMESFLIFIGVSLTKMFKVTVNAWNYKTPKQMQKQMDENRRKIMKKKMVWVFGNQSFYVQLKFSALCGWLTCGLQMCILRKTWSLFRFFDWLTGWQSLMQWNFQFINYATQFVMEEQKNLYIWKDV